MDNNVFATIIWTREDIRQLLAENGKSHSENDIDDFLGCLDVRRFEEACIQDGWERLSWFLTE